MTTMSNTPNYDRLMDVIALVETAAIYIQPNHENIRIQETVTRNYFFTGEGEETGNFYHIQYTDVDLENDVFLRLQRMDNKAAWSYKKSEDISLNLTLRS
jgi:hypothetical protein|tara:strand:- start:1132 stop:1431 length:300 start_codon:yes stop_codon:yes gene_type:complete